jgi:hypothetical protein
MPRQTEGGGGDTAPTHSQPGRRWRRIISITPRPLYPRERPGNRCTAGWVCLGSAKTGAGKFDLTGIRSWKRPARRNSLYRLSFRGRWRFSTYSNLTQNATAESRVFDSRLCHWKLSWTCRPHYGPGVDSTSNRNEYQEYFVRGKGGRCVELTTLLPSCADCLEIWEPQTPGTLRACPGL